MATKQDLNLVDARTYQTQDILCPPTMGELLSDNASTVSEADIATVLEFAGLTVPPDRLAANHEVYASTLALIRLASVAGLGETPPATAFKAHWV